MRIDCAQVRPDEPYQEPTKQYNTDAGFDFYVSRDTFVHPQSFVMVPTNTAIAIKTGYWGLLLGRSSTFIKRNLMSHQGTIDSGYKGELMGLVYNPTNKRVILKRGERIFQLIVMPLGYTRAVHTIRTVSNNSLLPGLRGSKGLGSGGV